MEYEVAINDVEEQRIVSIRERREARELAQFLASSFAELIGRLGLLGGKAAGPPLVIYHEFGPDTFDAEVCMPVRAQVGASGRVRSRLLPAMTVARTVHVGPYDQLGEAHRAIAEWTKRRGFSPAGPVLERYLIGPGEMVAPAEYRTVIEQPVVATPAPVAV